MFHSKDCPDPKRQNGTTCHILFIYLPLVFRCFVKLPTAEFSDSRSCLREWLKDVKMSTQERKPCPSLQASLGDLNINSMIQAFHHLLYCKYLRIPTFSSAFSFLHVAEAVGTCLRLSLVWRKVPTCWKWRVCEFPHPPSSLSVFDISSYRALGNIRHLPDFWVSPGCSAISCDQSGLFLWLITAQGRGCAGWRWELLWLSNWDGVHFLVSPGASSLACGMQVLRSH